MGQTVLLHVFFGEQRNVIVKCIDVNIRQMILIVIPDSTLQKPRIHLRITLAEEDVVPAAHAHHHLQHLRAEKLIRTPVPLRQLPAPEGAASRLPQPSAVHPRHAQYVCMPEIRVKIVSFALLHMIAADQGIGNVVRVQGDQRIQSVKIEYAVRIEGQLLQLDLLVQNVKIILRLFQIQKLVHIVQFQKILMDTRTLKAERASLVRSLHVLGDSALQHAVVVLPLLADALPRCAHMGRHRMKVIVCRIYQKSRVVPDCKQVVKQPQGGVGRHVQIVRHKQDRML